MTNLLEQKGREGEAALNRWFNKHGLSYLYVNQSPETFAQLFKGALKRPDFLVLLESIGLIAVDVKNYKPGNGTLTLKLEEEVKRVMTFERVFRLPVWYAYRFEEKTSEVWYWISALKAVEMGEVRTNSKTHEKFLSIALSHFERIEQNADIGKLYTHRLPRLTKLKNDLPPLIRNPHPRD